MIFLRVCRARKLCSLDVVTGHIKMDVTVEGKPKQLNSRYTDVWIKGAKGWQVAVWQSTSIPAPVA